MCGYVCTDNIIIICAHVSFAASHPYHTHTMMRHDDDTTTHMHVCVHTHVAPTSQTPHRKASCLAQTKQYIPIVTWASSACQRTCASCHMHVCHTSHHLSRVIIVHVVICALEQSRIAQSRIAQSRSEQSALSKSALRNHTLRSLIAQSSIAHLVDQSSHMVQFR